MAVIAEIEYTPEITYFAEGIRLYESKSKLLLLDKAVGLVLLSVGVYLLYLKLFQPYGWLFLFFGFFEIFGLIPTHSIKAWLTLRFSQKFQGIHTVVFTDNGIEFRLNNVESKLDWPFYTSFCENTHVCFCSYLWQSAVFYFSKSRV